MTEETIHCKLLAKREGMYTVYVFQNDKNSELIMCTKLPNWGPYNINIGDSGYLTYQSAEAGESYYDRDTGKQQTFQYTNIYFKDFVQDVKQSDAVIL